MSVCPSISLLTVNVCWSNLFLLYYHYFFIFFFLAKPLEMWFQIFAYKILFLLRLYLLSFGPIRPGMSVCPFIRLLAETEDGQPRPLVLKGIQVIWCTSTYEIKLKSMAFKKKDIQVFVIAYIKLLKKEEKSGYSGHLSCQHMSNYWKWDIQGIWHASLCNLFIYIYIHISFFFLVS